MPRKRQLAVDPYESARVAGLRYVTPDGPGIVRRRAGKGFSYIGVNGKAVADEAELTRIRSLVIPPAWTNVWICPLKAGHLQATGRDARGRKQYRYHPLYRQVRDQAKYGRMLAFSAALPAIRKRVKRDLALPGPPREKVLATVVRLLETTCIRVGNDEYTKANDSYGLTTMKDGHVEIEGRRLRFHFRGKSGQVHDIELTDRRLAKIVYECQSIPGEELFQYIDEEGKRCRVHSEEVNEYLSEISGERFTAKDFRTWVGSCQMALELERIGTADTETDTKRTIVAAVKAVSKKLGNRPATCRHYYVHPVVLEAYAGGTLLKALEKAKTDEPFAREEVCVVSLLTATAQARAA